MHEEKIKSDDTEASCCSWIPSPALDPEEEGSEVTIHVSEARTIPDVAGKQRDEAAALLEKDGFEKVSFVTEKSNEREGLVLGIAPKRGRRPLPAPRSPLPLPSPSPCPT